MRRRSVVAVLAGVAAAMAAAAAGASAAPTTVAIKLSPSAPPVSSQVKVVVSGTIGAPGPFEVADYQPDPASNCAQTLSGLAVEFGHKITHVVSAEGPFSFEGAFQTPIVPAKEVLCAIVFPDPSGILREESGGPLIVPSASAELRYTVGAVKPRRHCLKRRHGRCVRYSKPAKRAALLTPRP